MLTFPILPLVLPFLSETPATPPVTLDPFRFQPGVSTLLSRTAPLPAQDDGKDWDFSYTYLELGATRFNLEDIDDEADIFYGEAALDFLGLVYLLVGYENASIDFDNTDQRMFKIGAGGHLGVASNLDLMGDIAWLYSDFSSDSINDNSGGSQLRLGARWMPWHFPAGGGLELQGRGLWTALDDSYFSDSSQAGFDLGARVHFLKLFSVGATYTLLGDDDSASINARVSF